jgi:aspartyl-tRNA(Asn)/glutamyl-tRNA(Gln) amidotransferase subunit B
MKMGSKTTRGWDDDREVTVLQREKEEAHDYRYFPDPDLVPVEMTDGWLDDIRSQLCELPLAKQMRYVEQFKLSDYDAGVLTAERSTADFFDEAIKAGGEPKPVCNWITQDGLRLAKERGCRVDELGISPPRVVELTNMIVNEEISSTAATAISDLVVIPSDIVVTSSDIVVTDEDLDLSLREIAEKHNLIQKSDAGELEAVVEQVLADNPKAVEDVTAGGKKCKKARGFLLGQVMQKTKGQANPKVVSEILARKLG